MRNCFELLFSTFHCGCDVITPHSRYSLNEDGSVLTFLKYASYNNGTYHCEATNSQGSTISREALYQYGGEFLFLFLFIFLFIFLDFICGIFIFLPGITLCVNRGSSDFPSAGD